MYYVGGGMPMENQETLGVVIVLEAARMTKILGQEKSLTFVVLVATHPDEGVRGLHIVYSLAQMEMFFNRYENSSTDESCDSVREFLGGVLPPESELMATITDGVTSSILAKVFNTASQYQQMMSSGNVIMVVKSNGDDDSDPDDGPIDPSRLN
jgi:hypothetical protein